MCVVQRFVCPNSAPLDVSDPARVLPRAPLVTQVPRHHGPRHQPRHLHGLRHPRLPRGAANPGKENQLC